MKRIGKTARPFRYDLNQIPCDCRVKVGNSLKGLDLIDRVSEELCTGGSDQDHCQEKCKKAKWLSEEALQVAEKRREAKGKGDRKDIPI